MADEPVPNPDLPIVEEAAQCRFLRTKGMYVYTDGSADQNDGDYDNSIYWCLQTMKDLGPDDEMVTRQECRNPARSCYEPT
jgi:hypothetical protein